MILKKISIQNIASIENAEVDFAALPLRDADLFLIHGETGAGKSTLIDAICLALYKNTPRLKGAPKDRLKFGNYELTSQDSANMLRHGSTDGMAKLDFVGNNNQEYTAVWSAHRTPKSINVKHYLLQDSKQIAEGRVMVDLIQTDILGMNFDDFCRTAVLAQGEFTRFLKSDDKEKSAILEKLTGTEYFSSVGRMIYAVWKEKDEQYNKLSAEAEGIRLLTPEEIESIEKDVADTQAQCATIDSEISRYTSYKDWLVADKKYSDALQLVQQRFEQMSLQSNSPEYKAEALMLTQWDMSQQAIADYKEREHQLKLQKECLSAEQGLSKRLSEAYSGVAFSHRQIEKDQADLEKMMQMLDEQQPHKDMFENSATVAALLQNASRLKNQTISVEKILKDLISKIPMQEKALEDALKNHERVQTEIGEVKQKITTLSGALAQLDPDRVNREALQLGAQRELLYNASMSLKELEQAIADDEKCAQSLADMQNQYQLNVPVERQLLDNMNSAKQSLEVADRVLHTINMATADWTVRVRAALNEGDKCPVCGNIFSMLHFEEEIGSIQDAEKKRYSEAKAKFDAAVEQYNKKRTEQGMLLKSIDSMVVDMKNIALRRKNTFGVAKNFLEQLGIALPDDSRDSYGKAILEGKRLREKNQTAAGENEKKVAEIHETNKSIGLLNDTFRRLNEQYDKASALVNAAKQSLDKCHAEIKAAKESGDQYRNQVQDLLGQAERLISWPNWRTEWEIDGATFVTRLQNEAKVYKDTTEAVASITLKIDGRRAEVETLDQQLHEVSTAWPQWKAISVEPLFSNNLSQLCNEIVTDSAILMQRQNQVRALLDEVNGRLGEFYMQHADIQELVLQKLVAFDAVSARKLHMQQDNELASCKGQMEVGQHLLQEHRQHQPWGLEAGMNVAQYEEKINALGEQKTAFSQLIGAKNKELTDNEQHVREHGEKLMALQKHKIVLDQWSAFCNLYGDTNGAKFRRLAQQLVFDRLLNLANQQLSRLSGRYLLETIPGSLSISLRDQYASDFCSPVYNLSGGESFMVSLSLALALSNMGREGIAMDTLFIDEGFGTLSAENQVKVMDLLQTLQHEQGKRVGIISHVPYLLERIPTQIKVQRLDGTRSKVEIIDNTK